MLTNIWFCICHKDEIVLGEKLMRHVISIALHLEGDESCLPLPVVGPCYYMYTIVNRITASEEICECLSRYCGNR